MVDYFSFTGHKEVCMEDLPPTFLQSMQRDRGKQKQRDGMFRVRGEYQGGNAAEAAGGLQDVGSSFPDKAGVLVCAGAALQGLGGGKTSGTGGDPSGSKEPCIFHCPKRRSVIY